MQEMERSAESLVEKTWLHCRSLLRQAIDPNATSRFPKRQSRPNCIPRSACRFRYILRPEGISWHKFKDACLLHAKHKAPFEPSENLVLIDRSGAAIWWWQALNCKDEVNSYNRNGIQNLPESACRKLPDGWHHLRLESGFEAQFVQSGMVVGSAWQRMAFDSRAWRSFVDGQGEGRIGPHVPPPITDADFPGKAILRSGGRVLRHVWHPGITILAICAFATASACGWFQGRASLLQREANLDLAEARRLEKVLNSYVLFDHVRKEKSDLAQARAAAGNGQVGIALADALELVSNHGLKVQAFRIDHKELDLVLLNQPDPAKLRVVAAKLENLAAFSEVTARESDLPGTTSLTAKVMI